MEFRENPHYEKIIDDLVNQQYSVVENFFEAVEVEQLRASLLRKYEDDSFKKAAIGNRTNEIIARSIRGDFILWLNEAEAGPAKKIFF